MRDPFFASSSKKGAPVNMFRWRKVYFALTRNVPRTLDTEVATLMPKTKTIAGGPFWGAAEGKAASFSGVTYCSRITYEEPFY